MPPASPPRLRGTSPRPVVTVPPEIGALTPHLYQPTADRPVRAKRRLLLAATVVSPHSHPWPQLTFSGHGVIRVTTARGTIVVPPRRAAWVPAGMEHSIDVVEDAELHTVYLLDPQPSTDGAWAEHCVVLEMGPLLHALLMSLDTRPDRAAVAVAVEPDTRDTRDTRNTTDTPDAARHHETLVAPLLLAELARAPQVRMGVPLPDAGQGDKRLRSLCLAVLRAPARDATLAQWAAEAGASERTAARLFRSELGLSWQQWRRQALLAHALPLLARGMPVAHVAAASGYASDSAFIAMFRSAMGRSPRHFRAGAIRTPAAPEPAGV